MVLSELRIFLRLSSEFLTLKKVDKIKTCMFFLIFNFETNRKGCRNMENEVKWSAIEISNLKLLFGVVPFDYINLVVYNKTPEEIKAKIVDLGLVIDSSSINNNFKTYNKYYKMYNLYSMSLCFWADSLTSIISSLGRNELLRASDLNFVKKKKSNVLELLNDTFFENSIMIDESVASAVKDEILAAKGNISFGDIMGCTSLDINQILFIYYNAMINDKAFNDSVFMNTSRKFFESARRNFAKEFKVGKRVLERPEVSKYVSKVKAIEIDSLFLPSRRWTYTELVCLFTNEPENLTAWTKAEREAKLKELNDKGINSYESLNNYLKKGVVG